MSVEVLLSRLERVRKTGRGRWVACCPAHKSKSAASLAVRELDDGRVLLFDFGGCEVGAILAAIGLELPNLFPPSNGLSDAMRRPRERLAFSAIDALRLIDREVKRAALLILVCAKTPEQLTPERRTRLMQSANLIRRARQACGLSEAS